MAAKQKELNIEDLRLSICESIEDLSDEQVTAMHSVMEEVAKAAKKKKKLGPQCKCIEEVNQTLAKEKHENLRLRWSFSISMGPIITIPVELVDKEVKVPKAQKIDSIMAEYCPFCGKKYIK